MPQLPRRQTALWNALSETNVEKGRIKDDRTWSAMIRSAQDAFDGSIDILKQRQKFEDFRSFQALCSWELSIID
jgi:hypothetical protein